MTKSEELMDIIVRNKNKGKNSELDKDGDDSLEVAGSEGTKQPLISCGDKEMDGSIIHDLYRKPRHKPLMGEFAEKWD
jgi:hypothetical protein